MAYWREWKSLIGGGICFIILGIIMFVLCSMPGASSARGTAGMDMGTYGILFLIIGIIMIVSGWMLRIKK